MRVKCTICFNEEKGHCRVKKGIGIHTEKRRKCDLFKLDETRADIMIENRKKNTPPSTLRPFWYHLDRSLRKRLFEALKSPREKFREEIEKPLDLDLFKSTATGEANANDTRSSSIRERDGSKS